MGISTELQAKYEFDWEILDVIIGGKSAIDSAKVLRVRTPEEAVRFLECYGYNVDNPIEKAELFGNFQEAVSFIRRYFLQPANPEGLALEVPRKIAEINDIGQLLIIASSPGTAGSTQLSQWACSIIKVMHTISHMDKDLRTNYIADIQKQILDRFYKFIHRDGEQVYLGREARDHERVDLVAFETKPRKARDSAILKMLHKPENVAEDIFDQVGIRFVTKKKFDCVRVVKYLRDRHVIMPANIKPSRSRNTLLNTGSFSVKLKDCMGDLSEGKLSGADVDDALAAFCETPDALAQDARFKDENPHSSSSYQAIQFTGRQLVKIQNQLYDDIKAIKGAMKGATVPDELAKTIERMDLRSIQKEIRFFYPFEVQVLDEQSHKENQAGQSSHSNYKKSQVQAAMKRVLGNLAPQS